MITTLLITLLITLVAAGLFFYFGTQLLCIFQDRSDAQTYLLKEQAAHVAQTRQSELNLLEATIKAHEKNGANKLRTELARLDKAEEFEAKAGFKPLPYISKVEHEKQLAVSREIIIALEAKVDALENPATPADKQADVNNETAIG